jgi:predicted nucleic acid-binding protein
MRKFIDTAPFIYLIENHPIFADEVINLFAESTINGDSLMTSVITLMEFGVKPEREGRQDIIAKFEELLARLNIEITQVDERIAKKAYQLRAKYQFLKGMDSIQIATAILSNCDEFVTNDKKLKKITEVSVIILEGN